VTQLVRRAREGDQTVLSELRRLLDQNPRLWKCHGDLAQQAEEAWLRLAAGHDLFLHESLIRKLRDLREELAGPDPSPLEKLLVGRIVACWLQVYYADAVYAQTKDPTVPPARLRVLQSRQESSERRFQAAIKQLAVVKKLLRPALSPVDLALRPSADQTVDRRGSFTGNSRVASPATVN
jgi:hypothetical protein